MLRQEISDHVVEGPQERYQLDWPGKREAMFAANAPIAKTLRPVREESVDFDNTKNLFIEGDNLDALKLLQESYLGKVKLIYIDPPYNTGKDFIYRDDFAETATEYLKRSRQADETGTRLLANPESNGRFHSDWLSMMYPRLKLARNLLADDGVIMVSIDDGESANLKRLLEEVFGEQNFIDTIAVEMSTTSGPKTVNAQQGTIVKNVEFVHIFRRTGEFDRRPHTPLLDGVASYDTHYSVWLNDDGTIGSLAEQLLADKAVGTDIRRFQFLDRLGGFSISDMDRLLSVSEAARSFVDANLEKIARVDRPPVSAHGASPQVGRWEHFEADHRTYLLTTLGNGTLQSLMPLSLNYRMSDDYKPRFGRTVIRGDLWKGFHQDMGNVAKEGETAFANGKKPIRLIKQLIRWANNTNDGIVMDFFAGSGTTAHAVMQANADDGGNRRFVMIQLDEVPDSKSEGVVAGYESIAQITRERIRRAGASIVAREDSSPNLDIGFRAFRVDTSNMAEVGRAPDELAQGALSGLEDSIKPDRSNEDLLFQVLLDWGTELSLPIEAHAFNGFDVLSVDSSALIACFDSDVALSVVREIADREPLRAVFRDSAFATDADRMNAEQIFAEVSPSTDVKVI